jgi:hypothetical protein
MIGATGALKKSTECDSVGTDQRVRPRSSQNRVNLSQREMEYGRQTCREKSDRHRFVTGTPALT